MFIRPHLACLAVLVASPALAGSIFDFSAEIYGRTSSSGEIPSGAGSHTVLDLYLTNNSESDLRLLSLFDMNISLSQGGFAHDDADTDAGGMGNWSASWSRLGGNSAVDSFVTLGAMSGSDPFDAALDPNFESTVAGSISTNAGWYNDDPSNGQGNVSAGERVMVGRFVIRNILTSDTTFSVTGDLSYNYQTPGVYFDVDSAVFTMPSVVPSPLGMAAFAAFGLVGRGRRR
jgi:hypothetical protein